MFRIIGICVNSSLLLLSILLPIYCVKIPSPLNGKPGITAGQECINLKDHATLVWVSAGEFLMGAPEITFHAPDPDRPQHHVYLDGFWINKTDVTVADYKVYCKETGTKLPKLPDWIRTDKQPMVNVTWTDAQEYAHWAGGSLPSEAQWEKAARGTDGRRYPWGETWNIDKCDNSFHVEKVPSPAPVGSYPSGKSPYGCLDMAGNVHQWCNDWYAADYYKHSPSRNPTGPNTGTARVHRGGCWNATPFLCQCTTRMKLAPDRRGEYIGFRYVVNIGNRK